MRIIQVVRTLGIVEHFILNSANFHTTWWDQKEMHLCWYTQDYVTGK